MLTILTILTKILPNLFYLVLPGSPTYYLMCPCFTLHHNLPTVLAIRPVRHHCNISPQSLKTGQTWSKYLTLHFIFIQQDRPCIHSFIIMSEVSYLVHIYLLIFERLLACTNIYYLCFQRFFDIDQFYYLRLHFILLGWRRMHFHQVLQANHWTADKSKGNLRRSEEKVHHLTSQRKSVRRAKC